MKRKLITFALTSALLLGGLTSCVVLNQPEEDINQHVEDPEENKDPEPNDPEDPTDPEEPAAHEHEFGEWYVVNAPNCTEGGKEARDCNGCDEVEYRDVDALGHHESDDWEVVTEATYDAPGEEVLKCSVCGEILDRREIPQLVKEDDELQLVYSFTKSSITVTDADQKPTSYAAYAGEHEVDSVKFTTADILPNNYLEMEVIQFKAAVGKLTMVNDGYKKVVLKCVSTYEYDKNFTIDGKIGDNDTINAAKVDTGKASGSGDNTYPCYEYTLEVEIGDSENLVIEKTVGTKGAGYVTVIELYK